MTPLGSASAVPQAQRLDLSLRQCQLIPIVSIAVALLGVGGRWSYAQDTLQVGYSVVRLESGTGIPVGTAVFSYTNPDGVLVTEAGVGAVEPVARGRIFVDEAGTRTGVALVNTGSASVVVNLVLRDLGGTTVGTLSIVLNPGQHLARFVDELFSSQGAEFQGSLTFESTAGLGAITLRQGLNAGGEPLYTTLPVVDLDAAGGTDPVVFPQLAAGGGNRTQVILINPSGEMITGRIQLFRSDGTPFLVIWDGVETSENAYQIEADGVYRVELSSDGPTAVGYAVVTPETGITPSGSVIFQVFVGGQLVTEAGVGVTPETRRRGYRWTTWAGRPGWR